MTTWNDFFKPYEKLFSAELVKRWSPEPWEPNDDDHRAAAKLHTQITSRITTQRLGYLDGVEKTALTSVYALFQETRDIAHEHPDARHFDAIVWDVLNNQVRPFTAKWHRASERGALSALDATDEFRAELSALQKVLKTFDRSLIHLRDGRAVADTTDENKSEREEAISNEMRGELPWGIPLRTGGIDADPTNKIHPAAAINEEECKAILARRLYYGLAQNENYAIGLALSGGGIRSATFSLGVLVALARRGLLTQFDYLSTVSGGGYLGSFLSAFLSPPAKPGDPSCGLNPDIGLCADQLPFCRKGGEAAALRHLRHHSKYLATGSVWGRLQMAAAQLYGMLLNGLGIAWVALLFVSLEQLLRGWSALDGLWQPVTKWSTIALAAGAIVALLALRLRGDWLKKHADAFITLPTLVLLALLAWRGLNYAHAWFHDFPNTHGSWLWERKLWFGIAGVIPVVASALTGIFGRLLKWLGFVLVLLTAIAAPLLFFWIYLVLYEWFGAPGAVNPWIIVGIGTLVYFFLLDINFTSPHRLYRNKLAEAYLIRPAMTPPREKPFDNAVSVRLSELGAAAKRAPYHLINCALNVPGSTDPRMQGRLADFFLFSPRYCGSPLTGYEKTEQWEKADAHLDLGTAMAISGAAAAPQMGLGTMKRFSFWLALLNVRLGYWARKPGKKALLFGGAPGLWFLLKEMLGTMNEKSAWLNLSDGGHIENLGVYELLRRRCKYIVAIDGEQDAKMTFHALTTLQRLAFIDFGITIDVDLDDLRLNDRGLSRSHFRFCRIRYPRDERGSEEVYGYLLYLKLSLTGNEGEFIRRYRLDEPVFPHQSTADQFFSETQFEAYRSLGEHVGDKLFLKAIVGEKMSTDKYVEVNEWFDALGQSLLAPLPAFRPRDPQPPAK